MEHNVTSSYSSFERRQLFLAKQNLPTPALFLDRDGVLIEDTNYIANPADVVLCKGVFEILKAAKRINLPVVIVTNQSGIFRKLYSWEDYVLVTNRMLNLLGDGVSIAAIYANSHGPHSPANSWRKPSPSMLLAAAFDLNLDLNNSLLIGDRLSDLQAGASAGLKSLCHVLSTHGINERVQIANWITEYQIKSCIPANPKLLLLSSLLDFPLNLLPGSCE